MKKLIAFVGLFALGFAGKTYALNPFSTGTVPIAAEGKAIGGHLMISSGTTGTLEVVRVCLGSAPYVAPSQIPALVLVATVPLQTAGAAGTSLILSSVAAGTLLAPPMQFASTATANSAGWLSTSLMTCVDLSDKNGNGIPVDTQADGGWGLVGFIVGAPNELYRWTVYTQYPYSRRRP